MSTQSIARKYANALYDIADRNGVVRQVHEELASLLAMLDGSPELENIFASPLVVPRKKRDLIQAIVAAGAGSSGEVARLLSLLADRDRLNVIREIAAAFEARTMQARRAITAEVTTAVPMTDAQQQRLSGALGKATGLHVTVTGRVDPSIIAGAIAKIGGVVYDGSAVHQMDVMKQKLVDA